MASEDLGYWTFRGSDVRALLFYLSGDVQGAGDSPRVSGGKGEERRREGQGEREQREKGRERDKAKEKERGEGAGRNEASQGETRRRESEGDGNEEGREGGLGRAEEARSFLTRGDRSSVNHSLIPSSLRPLPHSLHTNRGYVILIKRSRVTVEPSV